MKTIKQLVVLISTIIAAAAVQAADDSVATASANLTKILSCEQSAKPKEVATYIKKLGGKAIVQASDLSDAQYTLPNPVDVFGRPVKQIMVHKAGGGEGDDYNEYSALLPGESIDAIAKAAGVAKDEVGDYRKEAGNNNISITRDPGDGVVYVTCVNNVRSVVKTIKGATNGATK